ncbi:DNA primase large subunit-like isoform X1 [Lithobates pipiens]
MQFSKNRTLKINPRLTGERKSEHYPFSLQFYQVPPTENISLSEFETFAVERLKLLKSIENLGVSYVKVSADYTTKLENELRKLKFPYRSPQNDINDEAYDQRRKDHISHFILRLAYCQSEDLRRWFIQQEMDLFKFRFNQLPKDKVQEFLKYSGLEYLAISEEEKKQHHDDLINSTYGLSSTKLEDLEFYKLFCVQNALCALPYVSCPNSWFGSTDGRGRRRNEAEEEDGKKTSLLDPSNHCQST